MKVEGWVDRLGGLIERHRRWAVALGDLENRMLRDRLDGIAIRSPVWVSGLARSGSTILLELLARHPGLATHRYRDFPPVLTPVIWNWFVDRAARPGDVPHERAHGDGIVVTAESPEAFEEAVWMAFFPGLHDPAQDAVLDAGVSNPAFEAFYADHIRKLLVVRGGARYLAKANYNIARLGYLAKLFPDARFVVPVRAPLAHVASLMRQHARFCREGARDPRITRHMSRAGHFEFGLDRRPVGIDGAAASVNDLWARGAEAEGWARQWSLVYGHLLERLDADPALAAAVLPVRFEDLCADPAGTMARVLDHCLLPDAGLTALARARVSAPDDPARDVCAAERDVIAAHTRKVAAAFGYAEAARPRSAELSLRTGA